MLRLKNEKWIHRRGFNIHWYSRNCEIEKMIQIYEGAFYPDNFKNTPFEKVIKKLFASRKKYKEERNDLMQVLVKLMMNGLEGVQIRKDIFEFYICK